MINVVTLLAVQMIVGASPGHSAPAKDDSTDMTVVVVQNERRVPVTVTAEYGDEDIKLGVVSAESDSTLRVPSYLVGREVKFFVQPAGQIELSSEPVEIQRGAHVGVIVPTR